MILAKISFSALNLEIYTEGLEKPLFWSFLSESRCGGFPAGLRLPHLWRTPQCIKHVYQLVNAPSAQCTLVHGCLIAPLLCWCLALVFFALNIDTGRVLYIVSLSFFMPLTIYQLFTDRLWRYRVLQRVLTYFFFPCLTYIASCGGVMSGACLLNYAMHGVLSFLRLQA